MELLLENGAEVEVRQDLDDETPLHIAAVVGSVECVKLLLNYGADINVVDEDNNTPLHWACSSGMLDTVKHLVKNGARTDIINTHEETPENHSRGRR